MTQKMLRLNCCYNNLTREGQNPEFIKGIKTRETWKEFRTKQVSIMLSLEITKIIEAIKQRIDEKNLISISLSLGK